MPYDHVVVTCLLVAQRVMGQLIEVHSDGSLAEFLDGPQDWEVEEESARQLYERVFGEPPPIPPWFDR